MEKLSLFSSRLKELMADKSINQYRLARDVGISNQAISLWLADKREPKLSYLWILADYFDVPLDYLVGRREY